jgi:DNA (cytosine-5)-methyltransferase 1
MASQSNKHKLNTFHLFAGAGGGILADLLLGHNPIGACEIEPYPRDVLLARQRDGHLPSFPIWDDVCTLDGTPWRGSVDVLCGGFPCQDISAAGKGAGIGGERSKLWKEYARLIGEIQPRFVFAENSPLLRTRGLGVVLKDLAALGYNARWGIIGAGAIGAPHKRDRMWVLAYPHLSRDGASRCNPDGDWSEIIEERQDESQLEPSRHSEAWWRADPADVGNTFGYSEGSAQWEESRFSESGWKSENISKRNSLGSDSSNAIRERSTEPLMGRVAHGVANRAHRLKAIGNGQVPQCAAVAFNILSEGLI